MQVEFDSTSVSIYDAGAPLLRKKEDVYHQMSVVTARCVILMIGE